MHRQCAVRQRLAGKLWKKIPVRREVQAMRTIAIHIYHPPLTQLIIRRLLPTDTLNIRNRNTKRPGASLSLVLSCKTGNGIQLRSRNCHRLVSGAKYPARSPLVIHEQRTGNEILTGHGQLGEWYECVGVLSGRTYGWDLWKLISPEEA